MQLSFLAILLIEVLITMETVRILPPYSKFPVLSPYQVSILSWNILLPNSKDGWWCYKMYSPKHNIDLELTEWPARGSLIRSTIEHMNADIVCLQELCGESFYEDFDFMAELGYVSALYKKGRFRPATFWKPDVVQLVSDPIHKDRSLILHFQSPSQQNQLWVANVHLQAGNQTARRLRQMFDCIDTIRKEQSRLMVPSQGRRNPTASRQNFTIIIAGDMNFDCDRDPLWDRTSAVEKLLLEGEVPPHFVECGEVLSKSYKSLGHITPFIDTYAFAWGELELPPPTMVVEELYSLLAVETSDRRPSSLRLSVEARELIDKVFQSFASGVLPSGEPVMLAEDVERWLVTINGVLGRGSEYRTALKLMRPPTDYQEEVTGDVEQYCGDRVVPLPPDGYLTKDWFRDIYLSEIQQGKVWGVAYDLNACGYPLNLTGEKFTARYDRIFLQGDGRLLAVVDTGGYEVDSLPNSENPSDHLPISCVIELR